MQRPIPTATLLRFPLIFGGFLMAGGVAFYYRMEIFGDLEQERNKLFKNDERGVQIIEDGKREYNRLMKNK